MILRELPVGYPVRCGENGDYFIILHHDDSQGITELRRVSEAQAEALMQELQEARSFQVPQVQGYTR